MLAVRPLRFSQSLRAWSRGTSVKPPAAAPHNTPQEGTSSASVTQPAAGAGAAAAPGVAAWAPAGPASAPVTAANAAASDNTV
jgi:hypothetical protein